MIKTLMIWCTTQFTPGKLQYNRIPGGLKITDHTGASMNLTADPENNIYELLPDGNRKQLAIWTGSSWKNFPY
ncbi:MAG: hypothetical protein MR487_05960 [Lachnospiraceae bacterium]|nr:hypothetical protein [Lachnospiraceae bacterium]